MLIIVLACELVFALLSIPLMRRKVRPNLVYGYRTRATLADETLWYDANAFFGARFLVASIMSALGFVIVTELATPSPQSLLPLAVVALGFPVMIAGVLTARHVRRRSRPTPTPPRSAPPGRPTSR